MSFTIAITVTHKQRLPGDVTWLVCRLLVLNRAGFFCCQLCSVRLCSILRSVPFDLLYSTVGRPRRHLFKSSVCVFHAPVASVFVAVGTAQVLIFIFHGNALLCVRFLVKMFMNGCLAKWVLPCLAPLFRLLGSVFLVLPSNGLFHVVPATCFKKPLSSNGRPLRYSGFWRHSAILNNCWFLSSQTPLQMQIYVASQKI
jgi:hypothetical protein